MTLGEILQAKRLLAGLSQSELAAASGIAAGTIRAIEQGRRPDPQFSTIVALAAALGCTCHELTLPIPKDSK